MQALHTRKGLRAFSSQAPRGACRTCTTRRQVSVHASAALDPDNTSILVAGDGPLAVDITRKIKNLGSWVYVLQKHDTYRKDIEKMMAILVKGDAVSKAQVDKAVGSIEEVDGVITLLEGQDAHSNVLDAALKKGAKKVVVVAAEAGAYEQQLKDSGVPYVIVPPSDLVGDEAVKGLFGRSK